MMTHTRAVSADVARLADGVRRLLAALAASPTIRTADPDACSAYLRDVASDLPDAAFLGLTAPDGTYSIKVSASDATGTSVAVDTQLNGTVDAVDLSGAAPVLMIGSQKVPLSSVQSIGLSTSGT